MTGVAADVCRLPGTVRECAPADTLARAEAVYPATGITRVCEVTYLDVVGVPVWMAVRPESRSLAVSQGKGLTDELAAASAVMESIEAFHAENLAPALGEVRLQDAMRSREFLNPLELHIRPDRNISAKDTYRYAVADCLATGTQQLVPVDLYDLDFTTSDLERRLFSSSSNGLASGNTRTEAILHGICEIVERDQLAFWMARGAYDQQVGANTLIDTRTINEPELQDMIAACETCGLTVLVWDVSTTIDLPVYLCLVADMEGTTPYPQRASGSGCHPIRKIALSRAITEALQSRLTHICGTRDDVTWDKYKNHLPVGKFDNLPTLKLLHAEPDKQSYAPQECAIEKLTVCGLLDRTIHRLKAAGLHSIYIVDLQRGDIGIPVVFVIIPDSEYNVDKTMCMPGRRLTEFAQMMEPA